MGNTQSSTLHPVFTTTFPEGVTWEMMEPIMRRNNQSISQIIAGMDNESQRVATGAKDAMEQLMQDQDDSSAPQASSNIKSDQQEQQSVVVPQASSTSNNRKRAMPAQASSNSTCKKPKKATSARTSTTSSAQKSTQNQQLDSTSDLSATNEANANANKGGCLWEVTYPLDSEMYLPSASFLEMCFKHENFQDQGRWWKTSTIPHNLQSKYTNNSTADSCNDPVIEQDVNSQRQSDGSTINPKSKAKQQSDPLESRMEYTAEYLEKHDLCKNEPSAEEQKKYPHAFATYELFNGESLTLTNIFEYGTDEYKGAIPPALNLPHFACKTCGKDAWKIMVPSSGKYHFVPIKTVNFKDPELPNLTEEKRIERQKHNLKHAQKTIDLFETINTIQSGFHSEHGGIKIKGQVPQYQLDIAFDLFDEYNKALPNLAWEIDNPPELTLHKGAFDTESPALTPHGFITCYSPKRYPFLFLALCQDWIDLSSVGHKYPSFMDPVTSGRTGTNMKKNVSRKLALHVGMEQSIISYFCKARTHANATVFARSNIGSYIGTWTAVQEADHTNEETRRLTKPLAKEFIAQRATLNPDAACRMVFYINFLKTNFRYIVALGGSSWPAIQKYYDNGFAGWLRQGGKNNTSQPNQSTADVEERPDRPKNARGILSITRLACEHHTPPASEFDAIAIADSHSTSLTMQQWDVVFKYHPHYVNLDPNKTRHYVTDSERKHYNYLKLKLAIENRHQPAKPEEVAKDGKNNNGTLRKTRTANTFANLATFVAEDQDGQYEEKKDGFPTDSEIAAVVAAACEDHDLTIDEETGKVISTGI